MWLMTSQLCTFRARSILWRFVVPKLILLFTKAGRSAQPYSISITLGCVCVHVSDKMVVREEKHILLELKILCQQNLSKIDFRLSSTRRWFIWSRNFFGTVRIKIQIFIARQQQPIRLGCFRSSSINRRMKRKSWDLDQKRFCDCVETVTLWRHKACLWRLWRNRDAVTLWRLPL